MQVFGESSTGVTRSEGTLTVTTAAWDHLRVYRSLSLPFDASAILVALATTLAGPTRRVAEPQLQTTAVFAQLSLQVLNPKQVRKSAAEEDVMFESPNWLGHKIAALKARGFIRRNARS